MVQSQSNWTAQNSVSLTGVTGLLWPSLVRKINEKLRNFVIPARANTTSKGMLHHLMSNFWTIRSSDTWTERKQRSQNSRFSKAGNRSFCSYDTHWRRFWSCRQCSACPVTPQEVLVWTYDYKIPFPNAQPVFPGPTPNLALQLRSTCCILSTCGLIQSVASAVAAAEAVTYHSQEWITCGQSAPHYAEL